jgi:dienelactone hydrolase
MAAVCGLTLTLAAQASAQPWPLHYPEPPTSAARVAKNIPYATAGSTPLFLDVYRPGTSNAPAPALIFYKLYWPAEGPSARVAGDWYHAWARLAAARGIVAILPDLRAEPGTGNASTPARALGDDFRLLVAHVTQHAAEYGIDADRIAVYAASGSTWAALPAIQDPAQTAIKAAVIYYGGANVDRFRADLPLLWVRAGLDSAGINSSIATGTALALAQNAPVTLVNHPTGRHGFEGRDDNAATRQIIEQTLEFVGLATTPAFQTAIRTAPPPQ